MTKRLERGMLKIYLHITVYVTLKIPFLYALKKIDKFLMVKIYYSKFAKVHFFYIALHLCICNRYDNWLKGIKYK